MKIIFLLLLIVVWLFFFKVPFTIESHDPAEMNRWLRDIRLVSNQSFETDAHVGQSGRRSTPLDPEKYPHVYHYLDAMFSGFRVSRAIPVEHRLYFTGSNGMDWHKDERLLPGIKYYEIVWTLHNDSDSVFQWSQWGVTRTLRPKAGTLVWVRPEDICHRVTPVTRGSREILKFVVVPTGVHVV
jgi:hypothetical protein